MCEVISKSIRKKAIEPWKSVLSKIAGVTLTLVLKFWIKIVQDIVALNISVK